jgi:hypothetical protein
MTNDVIVLNESQISISPNPASDYIEISIKSHSVNKGLQPLVHGDEFGIYDVLGNMVVSSVPSQTLQWDISTLKIDVSALPHGVYFVKIGALVKKFVKK